MIRTILTKCNVFGWFSGILMLSTIIACSKYTWIHNYNYIYTFGGQNRGQFWLENINIYFYAKFQGPSLKNDWVMTISIISIWKNRSSSSRSSSSSRKVKNIGSCHLKKMTAGPIKLSKTWRWWTQYDLTWITLKIVQTPYLRNFEFGQYNQLNIYVTI